MDLINTIYLLTHSINANQERNPDADDLLLLLKEVKKDELKVQMKKVLRKEIKETQSLGVLNPLLKGVKPVESSQGNTNKKGCDTKLITINFDDEKFDPSKIEGIMSQFLKSKMFKTWKWCLEQRSDNYNYYGYHVHLLCRDFPTSKSRVIELAYRHFKTIISGKNYIDVRNMPVDNGVDNYVSGVKDSPEKMKKVPFDISMRKKHKIKDLYISPI